MGKSLEYPEQMIGPYFCGLGWRVVNHTLFSWGKDIFCFLADQGLGHRSADSYSKDATTSSDPTLPYAYCCKPSLY